MLFRSIAKLFIFSDQKLTEFQTLTFKLRLRDIARFWLNLAS